MPAPTRWSLSPTDAAFVAALRYLPAAFFGGYVLLGTVAALSLVPALLANPVALAAVVLFALVGGPLSLLYLWPMLRDPDQRPAPDEGAWFADLKPTRIVAAALTGSVLVAATFVLFGRVAQLVLIVVCLLVPLVVVSFFRGEGAVDPGAGTLTYRGHTVDASLLRRVRTLRLGPVRLVVLRYHARVGGGWKPRVFLVPERAGADVEAVLRDGVVATPERDARTPDRAAQGLLVVVGAAFVLTGVAIATPGGVPLGIRGYVGAVAAALGALFLLGAYYIA